MKPLLAASMLSCVIALTACAHAGATDASASKSPTAKAGETIALQPGGSVALTDGSQLRFVAVTSDSRCKPNVQCIWAGEAVLDFQWIAADGAKTALTFNSSNDQGKSASAWSFELQSLDFADPPKATLRIGAK